MRKLDYVKYSDIYDHQRQQPFSYYLMITNGCWCMLQNDFVKNSDARRGSSAVENGFKKVLYKKLNDLPHYCICKVFRQLLRTEAMTWYLASCLVPRGVGLPSACCGAAHFRFCSFL